MLTFPHHMRYAKAYVVNPPSPPGYVSNKDSMGGFGQLFPTGATLFPPLDLVYLGSYLVEKGFPAEFLECLREVGLTRGNSWWILHRNCSRRATVSAAGGCAHVSSHVGLGSRGLP